MELIKSASFDEKLQHAAVEDLDSAIARAPAAGKRSSIRQKQAEKWLIEATPTLLPQGLQTALPPATASLSGNGAKQGNITIKLTLDDGRHIHIRLAGTRHLTPMHEGNIKALQGVVSLLKLA